MNHNSKDKNKSRRNVPIDGISGRPPVRFNQGGNNSGFGTEKRSSTLGQPTRSQPNVLNDFKRREGFHTTQQQPINSSPRTNVARTQETVFIDRNSTKQKSGLFGRKKKNQYDNSRAKKKHVSKKKKFLRVFLVLLIIIAIITGFLFAKGYINLKKVLQGGGSAAALQENVDPAKLNGEGDGRVNILLLGRGGDGHDGPDLTDTIIIASIDPVAKEASLVSIPRDLYVNVKGAGSMKINAAFATGKYAATKSSKQTDEQKKAAEAAGFKMLEDTITTTLGLPINYHLMVDFSGFKQAVDTVGGVDLNAPAAVSEVLWIDGKNYKLDVKPGQQHMDGFEALAYSRSRHTSPRGDFDRAERQRIIITALKDKILSAGTFSNPQKISQLLDTFGSHVQTNFSVQDLQRLYQLSQQIPASKIGSIGLADPPNNFLTTSNIGGASVVIPTAGNGNFKDIQSFLRNNLKDSYLKDENASIYVLNGTTKAGLATVKGDELKSFGYTITQVGNAPTKDYQRTVVVDMRNGAKKYTQNYLEKRFGTTAITSIPDPAIVPGTADFVIILGSDQATAN